MMIKVVSPHPTGCLIIDHMAFVTSRSLSPISKARLSKRSVLESPHPWWVSGASQMIFARERREQPSLSGERNKLVVERRRRPCLLFPTRHELAIASLSLSIASVARPEPDLGSPEVGCLVRGVGVAAFLSTIHSVVSRHVELRNVRVAVDGEVAG